RVDDPAVAARGEDHEAAVLDVEAGRVLAGEPVEHDLPRALFGREVRGVAARTVPHTNLDLGGRQDLLEAVPRNRPGGERLPCDDRGLVRHHQAHVRAVEGAPAHHAGALPLAIRALKPAVTERIRAPDVERQVRTHLRTVPFQERHEPAEVIGVAVAHDERVDDGRRAPTRRSHPAPEPTGSGGPEQHNSPCARPGANKVSPRPSPLPFHGPASSLTKCAALADGTRLLPKCRLGPAAQEALEAPGRTGANAATRTMMRNRSGPTRNPNWRTGAGGL